jgi:holo-[acyl-carrier protein] synthase
MILGLGNDLVDIRRIEYCMAQFGVRFLNRIFSHEEQTFCNRHDKPAGRFAKRFAAKEACAKALGTGIRGVAWRDMCVTNRPDGYPILTLSGGARARLNHITPTGHHAVVHLTMSDEYPYAQAVVIISAEPDAWRRGSGIGASVSFVYSLNFMT